MSASSLSRRIIPDPHRFSDQAAHLASKNALTPETDWNYEAGYRYNRSAVSGSLYAYHTQFSNRLQQAPTLIAGFGSDTGERIF